MPTPLASPRGLRARACAGFLAHAAVLGMAAPLAAQDALAPGFEETQSQPLPAAFASYHTLSNGDRVTFDGLSIDLYDGDNNFIRHLGSVPSFVFSSFVEADPSETFALVGESSYGDVFKVQLDGSGMTTLCNLPFNYDAVFASANRALISAATCGFCGFNDIVRVNTSTGAQVLEATVPGASGPVAITPEGDIYYATVSDQFPAPPGSTDIVYWTRAQLSGAGVLGLGDATVFHAGLDGAASLARDPEFGSFFLAESVFNVSNRVLELDPAGNLVEAVVTSPDFLSNLELRRGAGPGHFHHFQPADGVFLHYNNGQIVTVRPRRPLGEIQANGPVVTFRVSDALPNSAMLVLWGSQASWDPNESSYGLFGGFLFHTGLPLSEIRRMPFLTPIDADGVGEFSYYDPGHLGGTLVFQGLMLDGGGTVPIASSSAAPN